MFFVSDYITNWYKTQEICDRVISADSSLIVYCLDKYITLAALKLIPDWFVKSKLIKKPYTALYPDENMLCFNEDSGYIVLTCNETSILNIDLNNINLDNNFDEDNPDTIILLRLLAWHIKFDKMQST